MAVVKTDVDFLTQTGYAQRESYVLQRRFFMFEYTLHNTYLKKIPNHLMQGIFLYRKLNVVSNF